MRNPVRAPRPGAKLVSCLKGGLIALTAMSPSGTELLITELLISLLKVAIGGKAEVGQMRGKWPF